MLTSIVSAPRPRGVTVSPAARSAVPITKLTARKGVEKLIQRMNVAVSSWVTGSRRKMPASASAKAAEGRANERESASASQSEVRVTRSASRLSPAPQARATSVGAPRREGVRHDLLKEEDRVADAGGRERARAEVAADDADAHQSDRGLEQ